MCGIVGYCGNQQARTVLIEGLKKLEYRGYDSSGICLGNNGALSSVKKTGKIANLDSAVDKNMQGHYGIGHTRWATHGEVNEKNAHPHLDTAKKIAIAHNGIIENFISLKKELESDGINFLSETDSEVIVHLLAKYYNGDLEEAAYKTLKRLEGSYAVVMMHADEPNKIIGARNGSPLVLGIGGEEFFLASDVTAMLKYTKDVIYLDDGDIIVLDNDKYEIKDINKNKKESPITKIDWDLAEIEKSNFSTFMEKEIFEQPEAILRGLKDRIDLKNYTANFENLKFSEEELKNVKRVVILAAGTSYYTAMVFAHLLEEQARIPAICEFSSEIRYRNSIIDKDTLYIVVSQSGETADTLYAMRDIRKKGGKVIAICNVPDSTIPREADSAIYIKSGPEIAVASTKAFTAQLVSMYLFSLMMARIKGMNADAGKAFISALENLPEKLKKSLETSSEIQKIADKYKDAQSFFFLGRGINFPLALEGALKLKEISYIHAEGFAAGELKHGPIALITEETPAVCLVPADGLREKVISNIKEVKARKGKIIAVATEGDTEITEIADDVIFIPKVDKVFYPFLLAVPLQLFAFHTALRLGCDVDRPRNLAKSVTVE